MLKRFKMRGFNPLTNHLIWLYHPIIVFDGKLYEAILVDGDIKLSEKNHLLLTMKYSPKYIQDFTETETTELSFLIDVVRKDYFTDFLRILENDFVNMFKIFSDNLEELKEEAKEHMKIFSK